MKVIFLCVALYNIVLIDPGKIGKINSLKSQAKKAFISGDYKTAVESYRFLIDSLAVNEDEIKLNLANSYFQQNDSTNAYSSYQQLLSSENNTIRSVAHQQLGVLDNRQHKFEEALNNFKQSLKANPSNNDARYNYEILKKKLEEKKKQEEKQQNQDQQKNNEQNKDKKQDQKQQNKNENQQNENSQQQNENNKSENDQKKDQQQKDDQQKKETEENKQKENKQNEQKQDKEGEEKNEKEKDAQPSLSEKLQEMKISEEKAKMLLEALKNQEIQYLQQNKRKANKPKDKGKPDW